MENGKGNCTRETAGKPIICKAAVCRKAGEALIIEDIEVAPPQAWEVRIKILCTSLCHTDVSFWKIDSGPIANFPKIFGHEAVGIVESIGEHIEEVKEGDTVLPVFLADCGECRDCKSPKSNVCTKFENKKHSGMPRNKGYRFKDMKGEPIHHFFYVSSFAEYTVVDITHIVKIDPRMPVDKACLLSCGVTTGIGAVWKVAQVEEGSTVAIFGLGAVGLGAVQAAKLQGAAKIIGVDLNPEKEGIGRKFGVTDFIDPKSCGEKKISEAIKELTDGGADYCFECIGSATVMQDASESTRQELCLDEYITHEVKLHDINKAFEYLVQGQSLRCIIWMDDSINHH
ncbi:alcohol dehydrogenase-like 2 isoform X3 [Beta vulgaris subsp. vulgaris]|uniref:alcohol dehydrogenase-like 2 isoform X3 n=1 Tax=Beta vulgaris subsp. vulgaris TaxID=3555 RepID=UPI002548CAF9|nr:alcohol dehydrogenase-like 2 isoform X3 [Beta vulgaris subsp. vulgaris]